MCRYVSMCARARVCGGVCMYVIHVCKCVRVRVCVCVWHIPDEGYLRNFFCVKALHLSYVLMQLRKIILCSVLKYF